MWGFGILQNTKRAWHFGHDVTLEPSAFFLRSFLGAMAARLSACEREYTLGSLSGFNPLCWPRQQPKPGAPSQPNRHLESKDAFISINTQNCFVHARRSSRGPLQLSRDFARC